MGVGIVTAALLSSWCQAFQTDPPAKLEARVVRVLPDGDIVVAGMLRKATRTERDMLLLRLSGKGTIRWVRAVQSGRNDEVWDGVLVDGDGIWVGSVEGSPRTRAFGSTDAVAFRTDGKGNIRWVRVWGESGEDVATAVTKSPDGKVWVAGTSFRRVEGARLPHLFVVALKAENGKLLLSRRYLVAHASAWLRVHRMVADPSGGFWLVGAISPKGKEDADLWVVRLDDQGRPRWMERLGGEGRQMARDAVPDGKGGVFILGNVRKFRGVLVEKDDILLLHMDSQGDVTWMGRFGTTGVDQGEGLARVGHSLVGVGWSRGAGGRGEGLVFRIREDGSDLVMWKAGGSREDRWLRVASRKSGGWIMAGWTLSWGTPSYAFTRALWVGSAAPEGRGCVGCGEPMDFQIYQGSYELFSVDFVSEWRWPQWAARWLAPSWRAALEPLARWVFRKGEREIFGEGREGRLSVHSLALTPAPCR